MLTNQTKFDKKNLTRLLLLLLCLYLFREKMAQAYDFALEKIGMDVYSYTIWNDYITFLKSV